MSKNNKKGRLWSWVVVSLVIVGVVGLVATGKNKMEVVPVGINEVSEDESALGRWDFVSSAEVGQSTGWYITQTLSSKDLKLAKEEREAARVMETSLENGYLVASKSVGDENVLTNEVMNIELIDATRDIKVTVVGRGEMVRKNGEAISTNEAEVGLRGRLVVKTSRGQLPAQVSAKMQRMENDWGYEFVIAKDKLKQMMRSESLAITGMQITLIGGNLMINNMQIDSVGLEYGE